jgi:hypothetical protein
MSMQLGDLVGVEQSTGDLLVQGSLAGSVRLCRRRRYSSSVRCPSTSTPDRRRRIRLSSARQGGEQDSASLGLCFRDSPQNRHRERPGRSSAGTQLKQTGS